MVSHICLLVELGQICNSIAASLCLKSCEDHSLLKSYNVGLWKNNYRSGPCMQNLIENIGNCHSCFLCYSSPVNLLVVSKFLIRNKSLINCWQHEL